MVTFEPGQRVIVTRPPGVDQLESPGWDDDCIYQFKGLITSDDFATRHQWFYVSIDEEYQEGMQHSKHWYCQPS